MKKILLFLFLAIYGITNAQNTWVQTTSLPFIALSRMEAAAFSIGNKGYIGTGSNEATFTFFNDLWEYDDVTGAWTQKADFGGVDRYMAVGFSINNKGYIGGGCAGTGALYFDFWEYDPVSNSWIVKTPIPFSYTVRSVGFSIGSKGYMGTGTDDVTGSWTNQFWEYDPLSDTWIQKASLPGVPRCDATGFGIGSKGYIGGGKYANSYYNDFWEYDPVTDTWTQKTNYSGPGGSSSAGFTIGNKGYVGTGGGNGFITDEFWEYDPSANTWTEKAWFAGGQRYCAVGFSIGALGYIGTGTDLPPHCLSDLWYYTPDTITTTCSAHFTMFPGTVPHNWIAVNQAAGVGPLTYLWEWGDGSTSTTATPSHTYFTPGYYKICLSIADSIGCHTTYCDSSTYLYRNSTNAALVTVNVIMPTGINGPVQSNLTFDVFPNPADEEVNIQGQWQKAEIMVYDVYGNKIISNKTITSTAKLQTSNFKQGIYFLKVTTGKNFSVRKFVKR